MSLQPTGDCESERGEGDEAGKSERKGKWGGCGRLGEV